MKGTVNVWKYSTEHIVRFSVLRPINRKCIKQKSLYTKQVIGAIGMILKSARVFYEKIFRKKQSNK